MKEPDLDRQLTSALARVQAPLGLIEAVMDAAEGEVRSPANTRRLLNFPRRHRWMGSIAASLLLAGVLFGSVQHHRAAERARADRDFARSLEIADRAMAQTRERLQRVGVVLD